VTKILVDEDLRRPAVNLLKSVGIEFADVRDVGLRGSSNANGF